MRAISSICGELLQALFGKDILEDPNFKDTPIRMENMFNSMFNTEDKINALIQVATCKSFPSRYDGLVILPKIKTVSFCPHHMLPVEYNITIAYLPSIASGNNCVLLGASKPERVAVALAKRPILQEEYTLNIAEALMNAIQPKGVAVIAQGFHSCMRIRGIKNPCASMVTSIMKGAFLDNPRTQNELFELIKINKD